MIVSRFEYLAIDFSFFAHRSGLLQIQIARFFVFHLHFLSLFLMPLGEIKCFWRVLNGSFFASANSTKDARLLILIKNLKIFQNASNWKILR